MIFFMLVRISITPGLQIKYAQVEMVGSELL